MRAFYSLNPNLRCITLGPVSSSEAKSRVEGRSVGVSGLVGTDFLSLLVRGLAPGQGCTQPRLPGTFINLLLVSHPLVGFLPHLKEKVSWTLHEVIDRRNFHWWHFSPLAYSGSRPQRPKFQSLPHGGLVGHRPWSSFSPFLFWGSPCV